MTLKILLISKVPKISTITYLNSCQWLMFGLLCYSSLTFYARKALGFIAVVNEAISMNKNGKYDFMLTICKNDRGSLLSTN